MSLLYMIFFLITILISVAFFTLFERKILGYIHARLGPNKILLAGVGQPFSDLIKLFSKMDISLTFSNFFLYSVSPVFMVIFSMLVWCFCYSKGNSNSFKYFLLVLMTLNGLLTFFFLFPGWSSGSVYSMMGSYRSSAQCISYEGIFFFCIMIMVFMFFSFNLVFTTLILNVCSCILILAPILFPWLMSILAESNRTPFDFAEGESELVSGFNTEYGSGEFSIIFLSEYMSMLFYSFFTCLIIFGKSTLSLFSFFFFILVYIWVRTAFPRLRYDKLMLISWKSLMFLVTGLMLVYMNIFVF